MSRKPPTPTNGSEFDGAIDVRKGPVVETIVSVADEIGADMVAMPTAGRQGLFDALRGSVTERVLREAPCPVLAVPVMGSDPLEVIHPYSWPESHFRRIAAC